jgi:hypothetical protein
MSEAVDPSWPDDAARNVHYIQARKAFESPVSAYPARLIAIHGCELLVEQVGAAERVPLVVARPDRFAAVLERPDVTRLSGAPLVLVSEVYGVLGVATGPSEAPAQLRIDSIVSRLEDGESVEIPACSDEQPSLQLFAIRLTTRVVPDWADQS